MLERLLIVGLGSIGARHARIARAIAPDVRIVAWRRRPSDSPIPGIEGVVSTLGEALDFRPQLAVIASPASLHLDAAIPLAAAGVHLLVEKPIAGSPEGVEELIETCRTRRVTLMVGYNLRFLPSLQRFRELILEQRVGRVLSVRAEVGQHLPTWRPGADYRQTVSAKAALGGGVLLELSHEIDYLRWLFGEVEWVTATARRQSGLEIDVEDTAHLVMGFCARPGETPVVAALSMDFVRHDSVRSCTVIGETGTLRWNALTSEIALHEAGGSGWITVSSMPSERDESYTAEWRHLLACVETGGSPAITGEDALATLLVVEAAKQSSRDSVMVCLDARCEAGAAARSSA
jgi:predicted dehydrogenase